jgi:prepilin-type N-terminal cleavage/methylation domain-containing protein
MTPQRVSPAFTLIEILLVVVIMGVILALAAPNFSNGYGRFQLNQTVDDLLSVSRWAQAMAIGQERIYSLSLSSDRLSYRLERISTDDENNGQDNFEPVNGALGRMHAIPGAVRLETDKDRIEYYPDGTIDPATIELSCSNQKITLSSTEVRGMMMKVDNE